MHNGIIKGQLRLSDIIGGIEIYTNEQTLARGRGNQTACQSDTKQSLERVGGRWKSWKEEVESSVRLEQALRGRRNGR
jgi:hypothetical protein